MNIKQIIVSIGISLGFIVVMLVAISFLNSLKDDNSKVSGVTAPDSADDMAAMHAPPPPADNARFNSLVNNAAPEFTLDSYDGKKVSLSDYKGKNVVLFFSEGAMCYPSCWDQINAFTKDSGFAKKDAVVLTIVVDPKTEWDGVVKQDPRIASATVLLDVSKQVSKDYGVLTVDSSMHRGNFPGHTYVVIDKNGIVRAELDDPNMKINNKELLADLSEIY